MNLTRYEKEMLDGKHGPVLQKAMELLVGVGDCFEAEHLIPVSSALLACSEPVSIGKAGTKYIKDMAAGGARFVIPVLTDVACLDMWRWQEMGFGEEIYQAQKGLSDAIAQMGGITCNTCTPYYLGHIPRSGEHLAWGESSAVVYVNSVIGARTNNEAGFTALAAGLTGKTPAYGMHLDQNRFGNIKIEITTPLNGETDYGALGTFAGKIAQDDVPVFSGIPESATHHELLSLCAAVATSGTVAHMHVVGITPEAPTEKAAIGGAAIGSADMHEFGAKELDETRTSLSAANPEQIDLIIFGCPHLSIEQVKATACLLNGRKLKSGVDMWLLVPHVVKKYAEDMGYDTIIESAGAKLVSNTCPTIMPADHLQNQGYRHVATNSAKLIYYIEPTQNVRCYFGESAELVERFTENKNIEIT